MLSSAATLIGVKLSEDNAFAGVLMYAFFMLKIERNKRNGVSNKKTQRNRRQTA